MVTVMVTAMAMGMAMGIPRDIIWKTKNRFGEKFCQKLRGL
jgi:hypothetical protein